MLFKVKHCEREGGLSHVSATFLLHHLNTNCWIPKLEGLLWLCPRISDHHNRLPGQIWIKDVLKWFLVLSEYLLLLGYFYPLCAVSMRQARRPVQRIRNGLRLKSICHVSISLDRHPPGPASGQIVCLGFGFPMQSKRHMVKIITI